MRWLLVLLLAACPGHSTQPTPVTPSHADDTAVRIRIAQAEARRAGGIAELADLAVHGAKPERVLALRGLGRIGGDKALDALVGALGDSDAEIVGAAARAIGIALSLDPDDVNDRRTQALIAALPHAPVPVIEAIGRGGDASAIPVLVTQLAQTDAMVRTTTVIALGRYGRRQVELPDDARAAIVKLAGEPGLATPVRFAIAWALAREQLPKAGKPEPLDAAGAVLVKLLGDPDAEVRAQSANALLRRKWIRGAKDALVRAADDADWRVAVEAVRALGSDIVTVEAIAAPVLRRYRNLERDPRGAHVVMEALRAAQPHGTLQPIIGMLNEIAITDASKLPPLTRGWIDCLVVAAQQRVSTTPNYGKLASCGNGGLPDHLRLPLVGELIGAGVGSLADRRPALRTLLAHADARVRLAGMTALDPMWKDGDVGDHRAAVATVIAGLGSPDPIVAGGAADVAGALYDRVTDGRDELDAAIVTRARAEKLPELAASLLELVGKHAIASGKQACDDQLHGPPVIARAAAKCLAGLGAPAAAQPMLDGQPPHDIDVTSVINRKLRWHVMTTRGDLVFGLRPDVAPWTVATIVALTRKGFYDGLEFHRVVPNFVVQGGDPTESGWGGPDFTIPAEPGGAYEVGGVGIADSGRDTGGSQWFVMHSAAPHLDGRYTWFGSLESGQKSADALLIGDKVTRAVIEVVP